MRAYVTISSIFCIVASAAELPPNDSLNEEWHSLPHTVSEDSSVSLTKVQSAVCDDVACVAAATFDIPSLYATHAASLELTLQGDVRAAKDSLVITLNNAIIGSCSDCSAQCNEQIERCLPTLDVTQEALTGSLTVGFSTSSAVTAQLKATLKLTPHDTPSRVLLATPVPTYMTPVPTA